MSRSTSCSAATPTSPDRCSRRAAWTSSATCSSAGSGWAPQFPRLESPFFVVAIVVVIGLVGRRIIAAGTAAAARAGRRGDRRDRDRHPRQRLGGPAADGRDGLRRRRGLSLGPAARPRAAGIRRVPGRPPGYPDRSDDHANRRRHALFMDVRGGRQPARPGARGASDRAGERGPGPRTLGPAGPPQSSAPPRPRRAAPCPDYLVPLGRTVGSAPTARSPTSRSSPSRHGDAPGAAGRGLDVVHVRSPRRRSSAGTPARSRAPRWSAPSTPMRRAASQQHRKSLRRPPQVQPAERQDRRLRGGGVDRPALVRGQLRDDPQRGGPRRAPDARQRRDEELRLLFVGRAEERKGLPVLLRRSRRSPSTSRSPDVVGTVPRTSRGTWPIPMSAFRSTPSGTVSRDASGSELAAADVLCAPSLSGESFGMVLTEAFAAGTPVIASNIAGYSDVVSDGVDGILIPPGDPQRLAEELLPFTRPAPSRGDGRCPRQRRALRLASRRSRTSSASTNGRSTCRRRRPRRPPLPPDRARARRRLPRAPASASPSPTPSPRSDPPPRSRAGSALGIAGVVGVGLTDLAARRIGVDNVVESAVRSDLAWILSRDRSDVRLDVLPRRSVAARRPRGAAEASRFAAATSPRRR